MSTALPLVPAAAVAAGAALGALLRWGASLWLNGPGAGVPLGTLLVNCVGGLAIGFAMVGFARHPDETLRLFLVTGVLGGLTTFSAFSGESLALLLRGAWGWALVHTLAHVTGALACAALGHRLGQWWWGSVPV
jgi:CrcB protein